jgi:hypothetical protein
MPIREEVVAQHGETAITRNAYGSLCLNTPNMLFADVDAVWRGALRMPVQGCYLLVVVEFMVGVWQRSLLLGLGVGVGLPWLWSVVVE